MVEILRKIIAVNIEYGCSGLLKNNVLPAWVQVLFYLKTKHLC